MYTNYKVINFWGKTYQHIINAYKMLKTRYKKLVSMRFIELGAGLYKGHFKVI